MYDHEGRRACGGGGGGGAAASFRRDPRRADRDGKRMYRNERDEEEAMNWRERKLESARGERGTEERGGTGWHGPSSRAAVK